MNRRTLLRAVLGLAALGPLSRIGRSAAAADEARRWAEFAAQDREYARKDAEREVLHGDTPLFDCYIAELERSHPGATARWRIVRCPERSTSTAYDPGPWRTSSASNPFNFEGGPA